ncbi:hypothetical protein C8Q74DRAFT_1247513 [Fomes fomentarius]|nr:hypothetical protein C8Q74DRAFT_1247513 [Fomes fomentarius]
MEVDMKHLRKTARKLIAQVVEEDRLDNFTYKTFRLEVEKTMGLEAGALSAPEYKPVVHDIVDSYINEATPPSDKEDTPGRGQKPASAVRPASTKKGPSKSRKPTVAESSDSATASRTKRQSKKPARSASVVPSSDEDAGEEASPKSGEKAKQRVDSESMDARDDGEVAPPAKRQKTASSQKAVASAPSSSSTAVHDEVESSGKVQPVDDAKSESEMSVLNDDPPLPKRKRKGSNEKAPRGEKGTRGRKHKEPAKGLSKDEETIKRLKSLVVACGVRKVWSKEFKDLDKPSDHIRRLRQILNDLGMTGRMSMEQAKVIRERREFAQELEDVQQFAQKIESAGHRRAKKSIEPEPEEDRDVFDDSDVDVRPKRRITARQSIMAFLGDEDESDS